MTNVDEPLFSRDGETDPGEESDLTLRDRIQRPANEQDYAVLRVQATR